MNSEQRFKIGHLVIKYSDSGTESLIAFVAETDGMLAACQALLYDIDVADNTSTEWLQRECSEKKVPFHAVLQEVIKIVALFRPNREIEDHSSILGISADANLEEIKQAYRTLSRRYHPDTALPPYCDNPEMFIAINKAYHSLVRDGINGKNEYFQQERPWRQKRVRRVSYRQRKNVFAWVLGMLMVLMFISSIISLNYKKRAMLAGLQETRGAFIPPARKATYGPTGKENKTEDPKIDRPSLPIVATITPNDEFGAKVQAEMEVNSFNVQLQQLPQKESGKKIASQKNFDKEKALAKKPREVRQTQTKEKTEVASGTSSFSLKATGGKTIPEEIVNQPLGWHARANENSNRTDLQSIVTTTEDKDSPNAVVVAPERSDQQTAIHDHLAAFNEQTESVLPDVSFSPPEPDREAITDGKLERVEPVTDGIATEVIPLPANFFKVEKHKTEKSAMQTRLDHFFVNYIKAYEERNVLVFSKFFEEAGEENGKPFTAVLHTYRNLFAATSHVSLQVEPRDWQLVGGEIIINGQFKVSLEYKDGRIINGSGPIGFLLADKDGEFLIKKMEYVFETE